MNTTVAALLGSLVGAAAALGGTVLTSIVALKNERRRQESEKQATYVRTLRERSGAAFAQFFTIVQEIEWISWRGASDPDSIDQQAIKSYDDVINGAYRKLLGSMAMTASLNLEIYSEMRPILSDLYSLEERVGIALRSLLETKRRSQWRATAMASVPARSSRRFIHLRALRKVGSDRPAAIEELKTCGSEVVTLRDDLPPKLNQIMMAAEAANKHRSQ